MFRLVCLHVLSELRMNSDASGPEDGTALRAG